jgi:uncharacterized membrane protein (UPF0182 family)
VVSRAPAPRFVAVEFIERRSRRQRVVLLTIVGLVLAWFAARRIAMVVLDRWWFDSITDAHVWRVSFLAQLQLLLGVGLLSAAVMGTSVWLVLRLGSLQRVPPNRAIQRYHQRMGPAHRWLLIGVVVFFTLRIALAATDQWQSWLLFRHGGDIGVTAPVAGGDLGFHLFRLPFLTSASSFLRQLLAFTFVLSLLGHIASGAIRMPKNEPGPSRVAVAHLAMLAAGFLAVQALHDVLVARPSIATNRVGAFDGPGWTEMYVTKPGMVLAALVTLAAGFAAVWAAKTTNWRPFLALVVVAAVVQVLVVAVLPTLSERFIVAPAEAQRQLWSIEDNLVATRAAYDIGDVATEPLDGAAVAATSSTAQLTADADRVLLFNVPTMTAALQVIAGTRGTRISDTDVDRYAVDGREEPVFVAARSANRADVPESGWVQEHLVYTHGDGLVVVPADRVDADGRPDVTVYPDAFGAAHTPLYFGESLDKWYVIVDTQRAQLNDSVFEGEGIPMSSFAERLVLSLAVGEPQPLLSNELTSDSELLYRRSIRERVGYLAPFLTLDSDPYPVVVDGSVQWVIDGYTTSSTYPYSQFTTGLGGSSFNAARASVKATVDAETGETHLYRTDGGDDPIIDAWDRIFPGLLEPAEQIPQGLLPHIRYPTDLWYVQSNLLGRYHVRTAEQLFNGTGRWAVSAAPAATVGDATVVPSPAVDQFSPLAGSPDRFSTSRPYGPGSATNPTSTRDELAALAFADQQLDGAIHIAVPEASGAPLLSPQVAQSAIDADPEFARVITLLNANGSKVQYGPMTPVLVEEGLVWVRPIIVIGTGASAAPRLYGVAAVANGIVAVEPTSLEAVDAVLGGG